MPEDTQADTLFVIAASYDSVGAAEIAADVLAEEIQEAARDTATVG